MVDWQGREPSGRRIRAKKNPAGRTIRGRGWRLAYLLTVAGEGGENHKGNEESAKEKISQSAEEVGHRFKRVE
jgi:hypothetical protein